MTQEQFADLAGLGEMTELERVYHLAFFYLQTEDKAEFGISEIVHWLDLLHLHLPNASRLVKNLSASRAVVKGSSESKFKLHRSTITSLTAKFPQLTATSQEVIERGNVLPAILYSGLPGYIQSLCKQINGSYESNIFDGAAVLMRRLEEVLLILSYEKLNATEDIRGSDGNYLLLERIVSNAVTNPKLSLSRTSKTAVETFRKLGNYSAHKITYTCKREYIAEKIDDFRALIDELLHKSGLKV